MEYHLRVGVNDAPILERRGKMRPTPCVIHSTSRRDVVVTQPRTKAATRSVNAWA